VVRTENSQATCNKDKKKEENDQRQRTGKKAIGFAHFGKEKKKTKKRS
jgi:hypothetical protein